MYEKMASLEIPNTKLADIKDKVVVITGGSSGIGNATTQLCLDLGAKVIVGDLSPPAQNLLDSQPTNLKFVQVNVTVWESVRNLFIQAVEQFGRIDHVFANAGITTITTFLEATYDDEKTGLLAPPDLRNLDVNLIGVIYTVRLAVHYLRKFAGTDSASGTTATTGGSVVLTASAASFQNFSLTDYTTSKHGVLGLMRGLVGQLPPEIRLNSISPSWTDTKIVPGPVFKSLGLGVQTPEAVARSVVLLFTDPTRHGEMIYSCEGRYQEINKAEGGLLSSAQKILGGVAIEEEISGKRSALYDAKK